MGSNKGRKGTKKLSSNMKRELRLKVTKEKEKLKAKEELEKKMKQKAARKRPESRKIEPSVQQNHSDENQDIARVQAKAVWEQLLKMRSDLDDVLGSHVAKRRVLEETLIDTTHWLVRHFLQIEHPDIAIPDTELTTRKEAYRRFGTRFVTAYRQAWGKEAANKLQLGPLKRLKWKGEAKETHKQVKNHNAGDQEPATTAQLLEALDKWGREQEWLQSRGLPCSFVDSVPGDNEPNRVKQYQNNVQDGYAVSEEVPYDEMELDICE